MYSIIDFTFFPGEMTELHLMISILPLESYP